MSIAVYSDASISNKYNLAYISIVALQNDKLLLRSSRAVECKNTEVQEGEMRALNKAVGLIYSKQNSGQLPVGQEIIFFCDSQSLVRQLSNEEYDPTRLKSADIISTYVGLRETLIKLSQQNQVIVRWIPREQNTAADGICTETRLRYEEVLDRLADSLFEGYLERGRFDPNILLGEDLPQLTITTLEGIMEDILHPDRGVPGPTNGNTLLEAYRKRIGRPVRFSEGRDKKEPDAYAGKKD